jgi:hypothetical protein
LQTFLSRGLNLSKNAKWRRIGTPVSAPPFYIYSFLP